MSITVEVNYEQIAFQCESVCEVAQKQLEEMDRILEELSASSVRLQNDQTRRLIEEISQEKSELFRQMETVRKKAAEQAKLGTIKINNHDSRFNEIMAHKDDTVKEATTLQTQSDLLASKKLVELRALLDSLLSEKIKNLQQKIIDRASGVVAINSEIENLLASIEDGVLRQFTYIAYLQNPDLAGEALLAAGREQMDVTVEKRLAAETERIRQELEAARISQKEVQKIIKPGADLATVRQAATAEIINEKVRQKSLRIIMKAVADRGFIVDKKNIRIDRESNEVHMIAVKASGEQAEFRVFLDGKFIYDFHNGYKGQACQKDSEPFMQALEEVYGMHIKETREIWSNPDKISTMKYQAMNTNKNRG